MTINKIKKNKIVKNILLLVCISIFLIALFYLYKYLIKKKDNFDNTNNIIATASQNYFKGEPSITTINNQGIVNVNIRNVKTSSPCTYITSNNNGLYGTDNNHIYYFSNIDNKWYITPISPSKPSITNPSYSYTGNKCNFQSTLLASKSALWYYNNTLNTNQNINIDCLYYINLDASGTPIVNKTTNLLDLNCLRLPLLNINQPPAITAANTTTTRGNTTTTRGNTTTTVGNTTTTVGNTTTTAGNTTTTAGNTTTTAANSGGTGVVSAVGSYVSAAVASYLAQPVLTTTIGNTTTTRGNTTTTLGNTTTTRGNTTTTLGNTTTTRKSPFNNIEPFNNPPPPPPYDRIKLFAANDNVLFAVGCDTVNPTTIYYCNLVKGIPVSNNNTVWKSIQIPENFKNIRQIVINDSCVFIYCSTYDISTNIIIKTIYYNIINMDTELNIQSNWIKMDADILLTHSFSNIIVNNDILIAFEQFLPDNGINIVTKVWWKTLQNNVPPTETNNITREWFSLDFNDYINVLNIVIYNNTLIGYNTQYDDPIFLIKLYGYDTTKSNFLNTDTSTTTTRGTTTTKPGATDNIELLTNILFGLFDIGYFRANTTIAVSNAIIASGSGLPPITTTRSPPVTTKASSGGTTTTRSGSGGTASGSGGTASGSGGTASGSGGTASDDGVFPTEGDFSEETSDEVLTSNSMNSRARPTQTAKPTITYNPNIPNTPNTPNTPSDNVDFGMLLRGSNNVDNLNDFMAKNNILGSNVYISPMHNQNGTEPQTNGYFSKKSTKSKNIDSYFYPMINVV